MCKKTNYKIPNPRIDKCMEKLIRALRLYGIDTLACCCGHGKYPMTIVHRHNSNDFLNGNIYDFISGWRIPRKRNFYKRDKQGYYYIPEVKNEKQRL